MIKIHNSSYLEFNSKKYKCAIGKNGIRTFKKEGDSSTPAGTYRIIKIYYRKDRINNLKTKIKKIAIKKNMGWCDDSKSKKYNKLVLLPCSYTNEKLYRKDNLYDIVCVLNYNTNIVKKNKGSAIFIHIAKKKYSPTKGCVALNKKDLINILGKISSKTKIIIN